jgi:hypothetical protein
MEFSIDNKRKDIDNLWVCQKMRIFVRELFETMVKRSRTK